MGSKETGKIRYFEKYHGVDSRYEKTCSDCGWFREKDKDIIAGVEVRNYCLKRFKEVPPKRSARYCEDFMSKSVLKRYRLFVDPNVYPFCYLWG